MATLNNSVMASVHKPTAEEMQLPTPTMLPPGPGNNWADQAFRSHHPKKQLLQGEFAGRAPPVYKPTHVRPKEEAPEFSGSAGTLHESHLATQQGRAESLIAPKPVSLEGKVLRFYGYHIEKIPESLEKERVRQVTICFYLHDNTVAIYEPRVNNSGIQGGAILKRQKVSLSRLDHSRRSTDAPGVNEQRQHVSVEDFNVGQALHMCGTTYYLYDCDSFSRTFLTESGVEVAAPFRPPEDPTAAVMRAKMMRAPKSFESRDLAVTSESLASGGKAVNRYPDDIMRVQRFINDSGKLLKFKGYWIDDETNLVRTLDIVYFIEDDTIAVAETINTGDAIPKNFLSRRRVPKKGTTSKGCDMTFSGRVNGMRDVYLGDEDSYYDVDDFEIGMTFNLYGRSINIYDCDVSTRAYYENEQRRALAPAIDISHLFPKKKIPKLPVPPPTGFGSAEDSKSSCKKLVLCPPKKEPPKEHLTGQSLRFQMKLYKPEHTQDTMRSFILTYYLDDDEIMVSEVAIRNSGYTGGKFLGKQRLHKDPDSEDPDNFLKLEEIALGAVLNIHGFKFEVTAIDKNSELWLQNKETNGVPPEFMNKVTAERLQQLLVAFQEFTIVRFYTQTEAFRHFDKDRDGKVTLGEWAEVLKDNQLTKREEEAVAMLNYIDSSGKGYIDYKDFFAAVTNPMLVHESTKKGGDMAGHTLDTRGKAAGSKVANLKSRVLKALKERMEARCLNVFEMFRMVSTMPRAYRGRRADMLTLTNSSKDTIFTPVQLRRGVNENLGMMLPDNEMAALLSFFFPELPESEYKAMADASFRHVVDLPTFQLKFTEMEALGQLH